MTNDKSPNLDRNQKKQQAIKLSQDGISAKVIAETLSVPIATIYRWISLQISRAAELVEDDIVNNVSSSVPLTVQIALKDLEPSVDEMISIFKIKLYSSIKLATNILSTANGIASALKTLREISDMKSFPDEISKLLNMLESEEDPQSSDIETTEQQSSMIGKTNVEEL